jgi:hypothetical protein
MTDPAFRSAFAHQHRDPRGLVERIEAQIRERLEEALEMAGLKLLVQLRARDGRPAPEASREADRKEFEALAADLLAHLRTAFHAEVREEHRRELEQAEAGSRSERERFWAGQIFLARRLPNYWQRLERHEAAYVKARLEAPSTKAAWLHRLFRG